MYVCVKGALDRPECQIVGLDILGTRHPKIFAHILERMGFSLDCSNVGTYILDFSKLINLLESFPIKA